MRRARAIARPESRPLHPDLAAFRHRRQELVRQLDQLDADAASTLRSLVAAMPTEVFASEFLRGRRPGADLRLSGCDWECTGPLGRCVYDRDAYYDACVFCSEPEDRP